MDKHKQNLYHVNEIGARESQLTQATLNAHRMEIEEIKDMIKELHSAATTKQPINYSIETPPRRVTATLINSAAKLGAATQITQQDHHDDNVARTATTLYLPQYKGDHWIA